MTGNIWIGIIVVIVLSAGGWWYLNHTNALTPVVYEHPSGFYSFALPPSWEEKNDGAYSVSVGELDNLDERMLELKKFGPTKEFGPQTGAPEVYMAFAFGDAGTLNQLKERFEPINVDDRIGYKVVIPVEVNVEGGGTKNKTLRIVYIPIERIIGDRTYFLKIAPKSKTISQEDEVLYDQIVTQILESMTFNESRLDSHLLPILKESGGIPVGL